MARYLKGQHNAICDLCGFSYKSGEMRLNWQNQLVCPADYEPKHPQLTIKPRRDRQSVRNARPRPNEEVELADPPLTQDQMV